MSLFENLVKTYDAYDKKGNFIGIMQPNGSVLAPVAHTTLRPDIIITLDNEGNFVSAEKYDAKGPRVAVPSNEDAEVRTGSGAVNRPYSLCDHLKYMVKGSKPYVNFNNLLSDWDSSVYSHPILSAVKKYLDKGTIVGDLQNAKMIKEKWDDENIVWKFVGFPDLENNTYCWMIPSLMTSWINYYLDVRRETEKTDLCMITGGIDSIVAKHPKNLIPNGGNAKIISSNDDDGYTYRGRFANSAQAHSVSYLASQKAHNALRFLSGDQSVKYKLSDSRNGRVFICWNPSGIEVPNPGDSLFPDENEPTPASVTMASYKDQLNKTLTGFKSGLKDKTENVVIASFEKTSKTTGRLSVTDYAEINICDYFDNLYKWDEECCWRNYKYGVQAPPLTKIVEFAFGRPSKTEMVVDDKVWFSHLHSLIRSRIYGGEMPLYVVKTLVEKASRLDLYDTIFTKKYGTTQREALLTTVCSVLKKFYKDHGMEIEMSVQTNNKDINYLYGRLLAVMEKIEKDAMCNDAKRGTNAIRLQSRFIKTPLKTTEIIMRQLRSAYIPKLEAWQKVTYEKLIDEIMDKIGSYSEKEMNQPLKELYLIGYSQQRNAFYEKKKAVDTNKNIEE
ncbi:MAG: type I-C CRISPR-associated protein Cas8c/Csd1 [Anaerolineaceae bacterium]|nr:type I-C CRISPR-associated protein Cas8c/Csd1 [Anaerolineaceae bacterium]